MPSNVNNQFALNLLRFFGSTAKQTSVVVSPFSVESVLKMTLAGAQGTTADEIADVLGIDTTSTRSANTTSTQLLSPNLLNDNSIWIDNRIRIKSAYIDLLKSPGYAVEIFESDFLGEVETERRRINRWVHAKTEGEIQEMIAPGGLVAGTSIVLLNAIRFQAKWKVPFQLDSSSTSRFWGPDDFNENVPMMFAQQYNVGRYTAFKADGSEFVTPQEQSKHSGDASFYPTDGYQAVEIPYANDEFSMTVILPNHVNGLSHLIDMLTPELLEQWNSSLQNRAINIRLPAFQMDSSFEMKDCLRGMGIQHAFDSRRANFGGMVDESGEESLYITNVLHRVAIDVNESGTEAAAATAAYLAPTGSAIASHFIPDFTADRPFVFMIKHSVSNSILFVGTFVGNK